MQGCTHVFDYGEKIIKNNLVRGIADPEIMFDLLGDPKTDRTLEETVTFIVQKELGKVQWEIQQVPHLQALKIHQIQGCHDLN